MLKIHLDIENPNRADGPQLLALAALFTALAQGDKAGQVRAALESTTGAGRVAGASPALAAPYGQTTAQVGALDPADNPAAGIPSPAEAFRAESPETATGQIDRAALDQAVAGATLPDPAAVFAGESPNVPPVVAPSTPPAGTPPAPPNGAQTAGASIPASAPAGVELDAEGLPWDATIHATSGDGGHPKTADGKWKKKRGVGETYVNERKAQLRAALAAGNGAAPAPAGAPVTPPPSASVPSPAGAGAPVPPPPPMTPPAPGSVGNAIPTPQASPQTTPAAAGSSVTMAQLLPRVTAAITAGTLTPDSAAGLAKEISGGAIDNVAMFAVRPDLIPALWARLDVLGIPA